MLFKFYERSFFIHKLNDQVIQMAANILSRMMSGNIKMKYALEISYPQHETRNDIEQLGEFEASEILQHFNRKSHELETTTNSSIKDASYKYQFYSDQSGNRAKPANQTQ